MLWKTEPCIRVTSTKQNNIPTDNYQLYIKKDFFLQTNKSLTTGFMSELSKDMDNKSNDTYQGSS